jgi:hypothetical protein
VGARDGEGLPWNSGLSLRFCDFAEANGGALVWGEPASPVFQI